MALANPAGHWQPYPATTARIRQLGGLETGWNGHHAARIAQASQDAAVRFLERVWNEFKTSVAEPTVVAPTSDGGVALEWIVKDGDRERGVEIVCMPSRYEYSIRNRGTRRLEDDSEAADVQTILFNVIKPHVAGHFILAR